MTTNKAYDLHLAIYKGDEYCGGTMGRVVTSDIIRRGERNMAYYAFEKATREVQKWLNGPRYFGCDLADMKVKFYLGGQRFDLVFNARNWTRMIQVKDVRIPVRWELWEAPVVDESKEIPDDDIPF